MFTEWLQFGRDVALLVGAPVAALIVIGLIVHAARWARRFDATADLDGIE